MAFTNQEVRAYIDSIYASGGTNADVAAAMDQFNVPASQVAAAFSDVPGISAQAVQSAYDASRPGGMMASPVGPVSPAGLAPAPSPISLTPAASTMMPAAPAPAVDPGLLNATVQNQPRSGKPTGTIDADKVSFIEKQLKDQYDALNQYSGYEYAGKKSELDYLFKTQAAKLAANGIGSLSDISEKEGVLVNKVTGEPLKKVNLEDGWDKPDSKAFKTSGDIELQDRNGFKRWGYDTGVEGMADYGVNFVDGQAVMMPVWKDTKTNLGPLVAIASIGLNLAFPGAGAAVGSFLAPTASAAVQAAIGSALISGVTTGVVTGDTEKALLAAALAGGGSYLNASGTLGEAFDSIGLTDFKDTFGVTGGLETTGQAATADAIQLAGQGLGEGQISEILQQNYGLNPSQALTIGKKAFDISFAAQDALNLAGITSDPNAIAQNLIATGVDPVVANSMANSAVSGGNLSSIVSDVSSFVPSEGLFSATPTDMKDFAGITVGGESVGLTTEQLGAIQRGEIPGGTFAEMVENAKFIIPGGAATTGMLDGISDTAKDAVKTLTGGTANLPGLLTNLAGAGIDYAALQKIGSEASALGRSAEARATAAGAAANVPFTPYTVTSGAGSTAFGTDAAGQPTATVTSSPEYQALRTQALGAAGTTLGAINPATAAESLFQRSEALAGPARQRETEQLLSSLGARGLLGMSQNLPTVGGTTAGVNPYLESLLSAQRTAQANTALQAQQFGTQEAQRQAALAQGLISTGQGIDTAAMGTLTQGANLGSLATSADQASAARQLQATLAGQALRQQYENVGLQSRAQGISGLAGVGRGLLGLPTQPGNTASQNILGNIFSEIFK